MTATLATLATPDVRDGHGSPWPFPVLRGSTMWNEDSAARRKAFLDKIKEDPYDLTTRKVFADFLDEYGSEADADLAAEQRAWTREKQDAIVWLTEFGQDLYWDYANTEEGYEDKDEDGRMTYDELIT